MCKAVANRNFKKHQALNMYAYYVNHCLYTLRNSLNELEKVSDIPCGLEHCCEAVQRLIQYNLGWPRTLKIKIIHSFFFIVMSQKRIEHIWFDDVVQRKWIAKNLQHLPDINLDNGPLKVINDYYAYCCACRVHIYSRTTCEDPYSLFSKHINEPIHRISIEQKGRTKDALTYDDISQIWTCNVCKINILPKVLTENQSLQVLINNHSSFIQHKYNVFCMTDAKMSFLMGMSICTNLKYFLSRTKNNACCLCDKTIWEDMSQHERTHGHLQEVRKFIDVHLNFKLDQINDEEQVMKMLQLLASNADWQNLLTTKKSNEAKADTGALGNSLLSLTLSKKSLAVAESSSALAKNNVRDTKERRENRKDKRNELADSLTASLAKSLDKQTNKSAAASTSKSEAQLIDHNATNTVEYASGSKIKEKKRKNIDLDKSKCKIANESCDKLCINMTSRTDNQHTAAASSKLQLDKKFNKKDKRKGGTCNEANVCDKIVGICVAKGEVSREETAFVDDADSTRSKGKNKSKHQMTSKEKMERNKNRKLEKSFEEGRDQIGTGFLPFQITKPNPPIQVTVQNDGADSAKAKNKYSRSVVLKELADSPDNVTVQNGNVHSVKAKNKYSKTELAKPGGPSADSADNVTVQNDNVLSVKANNKCSRTELAKQGGPSADSADNVTVQNDNVQLVKAKSKYSRTELTKPGGATADPPDNVIVQNDGVNSVKDKNKRSRTELAMPGGPSTDSADNVIVQNDGVNSVKDKNKCSRTELAMPGRPSADSADNVTVQNDDVHSVKAKSKYSRTELTKPGGATADPPDNVIVQNDGVNSVKDKNKCSRTELAMPGGPSTDSADNVTVQNDNVHSVKTKNKYGRTELANSGGASAANTNCTKNITKPSGTLGPPSSFNQKPSNSNISPENSLIQIMRNSNSKTKTCKPGKSGSVDLNKPVIFENSNESKEMCRQDESDGTAYIEEGEEEMGGIERSSSNSDMENDMVNDSEHEASDDEEREEAAAGQTVEKRQPVKKEKAKKAAGKNERQSVIQQFWCSGCCSFDKAHKLEQHMKSCTAWAAVKPKDMICKACQLFLIIAETDSLEAHNMSAPHLNALKLRLEATTKMRGKRSIEQVKDVPKVQDLIISGLSSLDDRLLVVHKICKQYGKMQSVKLSDNGDEAVVRFWLSSDLHKAVQHSDHPPLSFSIRESSMSDGLENVLVNEDMALLLSDWQKLDEYCSKKSQLAVEMMKSESEQSKQKQLLADLYSQIGKCLGDDWQFLLFGSRRTGLSLTSSDADIFVGTEKMYYGQEYQSRRDQSKIVEYLVECIERSKSFECEKAIPKTRIPIVIFKHVPTGIQGDLSFLNGLSVRNTALIRYMLSLDERPRAMIMFLKEWVVTHGLKYILTSYAVTLLVFVFLARLDKPVLPAITQLRSNAQRVFIAGMDASFSEKAMWRTCNRQTVPQLLLDFFYFYSTFDFPNNFIYTVGASFYPRRSLAEGGQGLPMEVKRKSRLIARFGEFEERHQMCVMDPFDLKYNMTVRIKQHAYYAILQLLQQSFILLKGTLNNETP